MRRHIRAKLHDRCMISAPGGLGHFSTGGARKKWGALDLWEDWEHASPFTAGQHYFNVGLTHEVAFAADRFGGVRKLPKHFDSYEELARKVEYKYVRGWVAKDGSRMFIWDDLDEMLTSPTGRFEYFKGAVLKLRRKARSRTGTELWDRGGERYLGTLGDLCLMAP